MKKIAFSLVFILLVSFVACKQVGKTNNALVSIEQSDKFSEREINDAINCVKEKFKDFEGCSLTKLWYDEEKSNNFIEGYLTGGKGSVSGNLPVIKNDSAETILPGEHTISKAPGYCSLSLNCQE